MIKSPADIDAPIKPKRARRSHAKTPTADKPNRSSRTPMKDLHEEVTHSAPLSDIAPEAIRDEACVQALPDPSLEKRFTAVSEVPEKDAAAQCRENEHIEHPNTAQTQDDEMSCHDVVVIRGAKKRFSAKKNEPPKGSIEWLIPKESVSAREALEQLQTQSANPRVISACQRLMEEEVREDFAKAYGHSIPLLEKEPDEEALCPLSHEAYLAGFTQDGFEKESVSKETEKPTFSSALRWGRVALAGGALALFCAACALISVRVLPVRALSNVAVVSLDEVQSILMLEALLSEDEHGVTAQHAALTGEKRLAEALEALAQTSDKTLFSKNALLASPVAELPDATPALMSILDIVPQDKARLEAQLAKRLKTSRHSLKGARQ